MSIYQDKFLSFTLRCILKLRVSKYFFCCFRWTCVPGAKWNVRDTSGMIHSLQENVICLAINIILVFLSYIAICIACRMCMLGLCLHQLYKYAHISREIFYYMAISWLVIIHKVLSKFNIKHGACLDCMLPGVQVTAGLGFFSVFKLFV